MEILKQQIYRSLFLRRCSNAIYRILRIYHLTRRNFLAKMHGLNANDQAMLALEGRHKGRRCFIIGNGPSLKIQDLQKLFIQGADSFAFNKIYLAFSETDFRPTYYLIEDRLVMQNIKEKVYSLEPFVKFFPYDYRYLFPHLPNTYFFYMENRFRGSKKPICFSPHPFSICLGETVTYSALQLAVFFGYNPIYLIGVDFSFTIEKGNKDQNMILQKRGQINHFHPDYRPEGENWYAPDLTYQLHAYMAAKAYAKKNGIEIYNATRGGKLEVFERRDLDEIFANKV